MVIADYIGLAQSKIKNRFMITFPIFAISIALMFIDFNILWRYFTWANQVTAVIALFVSTAYLFYKNKNYFYTLIPGTFMLYLVILYLLTEPIGFDLDMTISYYISAIISALILGGFFYQVRKVKASLNPDGAFINDQLQISEVYPEAIG